MKKNFMMRAASVLLVAVMLTTCAISGTFAKYITADDANDSARVAKWGVVVTADGSLFENSYKNAPVNDDTATVVSVDSADVVAPGTNNADKAFTFSITGTPEVDVKVEVVVTNANADVFLKGEPGKMYADYTTGNNTDEFELDDYYYPVVYTLKKQGAVVATDLTLAELKTELEAISVAKVDANTNLSTTFGEYEITWEWIFNGNDKADTLLGNLATDKVNGTHRFDAGLTEGVDYNLNTGLKVEVIVTQID